MITGAAMQRHTYSLPRGLTLLFINLLIWIPASLYAHPHMSLEAKVDFVLEGKTCTGAWMEWTFDPLFSATIIGEHDTNRDGRFDTKENTQVYQRAFINLKNYGYFIYIRKGDTRSNPAGVEQFQAFQKQGRLVYRFFVPLKQDLAAGPLHLAVFDTTFYCAVRYAPNGIGCIDATGKGLPEPPEGPSITVAVNKKYPIYYNPQGASNDFRVYNTWEKGLEIAYPEEITIQ